MGWYPHLLRSSRKVKDEGQDLYATDAADADKQEEEDKDLVFSWRFLHPGRLTAGTYKSPV